MKHVATSCLSSGAASKAATSYVVQPVDMRMCKFNPKYRFVHSSEPPNQTVPLPEEDDTSTLPIHKDLTPLAEDFEARLTCSDGGTGEYEIIHPLLDGRPCNSKGEFVPHDAPPSPPVQPDPTDWSPFESRAEFELADFLFREEQMSQKKVTKLMDIWAAYDAAKSPHPNESRPPFVNARDMYETIDSIQHGDCPWNAFSVKYNSPDPLPADAPAWKSQSFEVWYRDPLSVMERMIGNPSFVGEVDYAPKRVYSKKTNERQYCDLMSGDWAWRQADAISADESTHGAMFAPVILGSDKTTVSVATGQNKYYPLYLSWGNVQNHVRRAHRDAVVLIGFLAIPKTDKEHQDSAEFRIFRRQLFHTSVTHILASLRPWMTTPRLTLCGDGHWRKVIYGIGPYIADYPEQVLLACIVQGWCPRCTASSTDLDNPEDILIGRSHEHTRLVHEMCNGALDEMRDSYGIHGDVTPFTAEFPRANIHELLSPDLLHQIIKGTFKDHLVTWVVSWIEETYPGNEGKAILAELDRRIAVVPHFPGLRRFPQGRGFKQWTGDDSKALMKVFLPAIVGLVPDQMVRALRAFIDFCYLVRRSQIDESTLAAIDDAVATFHNERQIFVEEGIREHFHLPRQHSLVHYRRLIQEFGAPNGLCSSITESKHIKAVKQPWRRSSRNNPLGQMLLTNQRLDKLAAARIDFERRGMLSEPLHSLDSELAEEVQSNKKKKDELKDDLEELDAVEGMRSLADVRLASSPARGYPSQIDILATELGLPNLEADIRRFLYDQLYPDAEVCGMDTDLSTCPILEPFTKIKVFHSAIATYHAPSDLSGIGGMHREWIRSTPRWQKGGKRQDTVFINKDPDRNGFAGLHVAQVALFFSFEHKGIIYPCAYVKWFVPFGDEPCNRTGMWMVVPDKGRNGRRIMSVIHIDSILRGAHLIGICGSQRLPHTLTHSHSLTAFKSFYVNKFCDHHANEIAF